MSFISNVLGLVPFINKKGVRLTHLKNQVPIMDRRLREVSKDSPIREILEKERSDLHIELVRLGYTPTWSDGYGTKY